nr:ribose 5-phosphate isomerase, type A [Tanacetum cinerariifolium]
MDSKTIEKLMVDEFPWWLNNQDHDLLSEVEINLADQYEQNLLSGVEIIDGNGNILRTQKITEKQVYKLKGGKKVLVQVNKDYQLIKNASGLCSRFMTLIFKQPNLCLPDAKDWKECKESCAAMLIAKLWRRFCIPQKESVDKVLSAMFSVKHNKREPNDFESFHLCYKTKDDTYLQEATRDMMVIANREISSKVKELAGLEGIVEDAVVAKIAREVINKLLGNEEPHCYGAGVTKSQISKFCCDLKRMRGEGLADENHFLKEKVDNQTKEIHTHKKQLEMCNKELETCKKQLASQNKKVKSYKE